MASMTLPSSLQKSLDGTKVEYVRLGSSGLQVSVPILGGMSLGSKKFSPWMVEEDEAMKILKAAYDRGINTWDTANMYSNGLSEEIFGKAIQKYKIPRQKLVIMTKCFIHVGDDMEVVGPMHGQWMSRSKDYVNQGGEFQMFLICYVSESVLTPFNHRSLSCRHLQCRRCFARSTRHVLPRSSSGPPLRSVHPTRGDYEGLT